MIRLIQHDAAVAPITVFATHLNAPCSSILLTQESPTSRFYMVIGKVTGETVFFPVDRNERVSKFESEAHEPITALASGDLRNTGRPEIVTVSCNGLLQSLRFPTLDETSHTAAPLPLRVFSQQINANVCAAEIYDFDSDGLMEFLVAMTDRVVRSYRFQCSSEFLVPLNKWEMPTQISGWAVGSSLYNFAFLSQSCQPHYVRLDFGPIKDVKVVPSNAGSRKHATLLFIPQDATFVRLMQSLVEKIVIVENSESEPLANYRIGKETYLRNDGADFVCIAHTKLISGLSVIAAVDPSGQMLIYAFNETTIPTEAVARCNVLRDVDHISAIRGPNSYSLFVSLVNIYNKVAIYLIDLAHIVQIKQ